MANKSRPKQLSFRVSEEEYQQLQEKISKSGKNQQEYILSCVLDKQIVNTDGIKELIPELKRIGNNLNQIAKRCNEGGMLPSEAEVRKHGEELNKVWQSLRRYLQRRLHCEPETVKEEMQATKELWGKTDGRTYKHYVQSYHEDEEITPEQAHKNAIELAEHTKAWKGHEVLIATHIDKGHIHTHFIVNSVNYENGHKLQWSKHDLKDLKERCNEQSRGQGLHVPEKGKTFAGEAREETVAWSKDTYQLLKQAEQGKVKSYVQDIALAVLDCKETAISRQTFIRLMNERGYGVDWQDSHKYITYTDLAREQAGEKACKIRDNKLEKYYNMDFGKESMEHEFERNARTAEAEQSKGATSRVKPTEPDRAGKQFAQRSVGDVERELRGIDEAVKSRTSKGRAEQAERRRAEQEAHQRAEAEREAARLGA